MATLRVVADAVVRAHADPLRDRAVLLQLLGESLLGTHRLVSRLRRGSHAAERNVRAGAAWVVSGGPVGTGGDAQRALRRSGAPPWAAGAGGLFSPWRRPRAQNKDAPPAPNPVADRREDENWEFLALAGAAAQCPQPRTRAMSASCERALPVACVQSVWLLRRLETRARDSHAWSRTCKQNIVSNCKEGVAVKSKKREPIHSVRRPRGRNGGADGDLGELVDVDGQPPDGEPHAQAALGAHAQALGGLARGRRAAASARRAR